MAGADRLASPESGGRGALAVLGWRQREARQVLPWEPLVRRVCPGPCVSSCGAPPQFFNLKVKTYKNTVANNSG